MAGEPVSSRARAAAPPRRRPGRRVRSAAAAVHGIRSTAALLALALPLLLAGRAAVGAGPAPDPERGRMLAEALCSRCHAVGPTGASPLAAAPPFRALKERYPIESLAEGLAEGLVTGHAAMPEVQLEPQAIADLLAWLERL